MFRLTYIGLAVLVLVASFAIVAWSFGLNTRPSKQSTPVSTQPITKIINDQGKKETLITGVVISKQKDGLILDVGSSDYTFVEMIDGEKILRVPGKEKTAVAWELINIGDPVKISSLKSDGTGRKIAFLKEEYKKK